ncbi:MAG: hypothetical protein ACN6RD_04445 [Stenotrophomonas maltophilia]
MVSLPSTLLVVPPLAGLMSVARKSSSLATSVPALTLRVTVAVSQTPASGVARQAW